MNYNVCSTCWAANGRAGMLINNECLNCYDTRETGAITIHANLERTEEEIKKTISIIDNKNNNTV